MKIAVTCAGSTLDDHVGATPERCQNVLIINPVTLDFQSIKNPLAECCDGHAAAKMLARLLRKHQVKVFLMGGCGYRGLRELTKSGIRILFGMTGSASQSVDKFMEIKYPIVF